MVWLVFACRPKTHSFSLVCRMVLAYQWDHKELPMRCQWNKWKMHWKNETLMSCQWVADDLLVHQQTAIHWWKLMGFWWACKNPSNHGFSICFMEFKKPLNWTACIHLSWVPHSESPLQFSIAMTIRKWTMKSLNFHHVSGFLVIFEWSFSTDFMWQMSCVATKSGLAGRQPADLKGCSIWLWLGGCTLLYHESCPS